MEMEDEMPPKEDSIQAFLALLVDPTLKKLGRYETPSASAQEQVAKQLRAVVLLYNYYLRKQFPQLEFLDALTFCKTAVVMNAKLITYMGLLKGTGTNQSASEYVQRATITEKMVKEACDVCEALSSPRIMSDINSLPVSRVALFVVDANCERCILLFGYITKGVYSLLERDVDGSDSLPAGALEYSKQNKDKNLRKRSLGSMSSGADVRINGTVINEAQKLLHLAFSAVREQTGIEKDDLEVDDQYLVYSLTKAKTSCQLYIMHSIKGFNETPLHSGPDTECNWVSIEDALANKEGAMLESGPCSYETVPAVSYFHLWPYLDVINGWLKRRESSTVDGNSKPYESIRGQISAAPNHQDSQAQSYRFNRNTQETMTQNIPCMTDELLNTEADFLQDHKDAGIMTGVGSQQVGLAPERSRRKGAHVSNSSQKPSSPTRGKSIAIDKIPSPSKDVGDAGKAARKVVEKYPMSMQHVNTATEQVSSPSRSVLRNRRDTDPSQETIEVRATMDSSLNGTKAGGQESRSSPSFTASDGGRPWNNKSNGIHGFKLHNNEANHMVGAYEKASNAMQENRIATDVDVAKDATEKISEKRKELFEDLITCQMQHQSQSKDLLSKIADCDANMNIILRGGRDAMILAKEICQQTSSSLSGKVNNAVGPRLAINDTKRRKLSEGIIFLRSSCQELNDICMKNRWTIPSYFVSFSSDSNVKAHFYAMVKIRGLDFEFEEAGELQSGEMEAKESAASTMLSRLYRMSASSKE